MGNEGEGPQNDVNMVFGEGDDEFGEFTPEVGKEPKPLESVDQEPFKEDEGGEGEGEGTSEGDSTPEWAKGLLERLGKVEQGLQGTQEPQGTSQQDLDAEKAKLEKEWEEIDWDGKSTKEVVDIVGGMTQKLIENQSTKLAQNLSSVVTRLEVGLCKVQHSDFELFRPGMLELAKVSPGLGVEELYTKVKTMRGFAVGDEVVKEGDELKVVSKPNLRGGGSHPSSGIRAARVKSAGDKGMLNPRQAALQVMAEMKRQGAKF